MKRNSLLLILQIAAFASGFDHPFYDTGVSQSDRIEFIDASSEVRRKREIIVVTERTDIQSEISGNSSLKNASIGKDGHDMFRTTSSPLSEEVFPTGEEYEEAYTVDPEQSVKSFNGSDINISNTTEDSHIYYNSSFYPESTGAWKDYWVDLSEDSHTHDLLSKAHRKTATIYISFEFPFYGHIVKNITIATGGFLYMGDYLHPWLAATQYAAPLLADFDTQSSPDSVIKFRDNGTALTVQWDKVRIHNMTEIGSFTFQVTIKNTGEIIFVYKDIPLNVTEINDEKHPVRVGISDAYIMEKTLFFVRRKIIFMYHKIDFKDNYYIGNNTLLYFTPLPTCLSLKTCSECVQGKPTIKFECIWCPLANRCSDGIDRKRQDWLVQGCDSRYLDSVTKCIEYEESLLTTTEPSTTKTSTVTTTTTELSVNISQDETVVAPVPDQHRSEDPVSAEAVHMSGGSVFAIILVFGLLVTGGIWIIYAYYNPHTPSGQFLIKYRPSAISIRRGEPQYTAAIHM